MQESLPNHPTPRLLVGLSSQGFLAVNNLAANAAFTSGVETKVQYSRARSVTTKCLSDHSRIDRWTRCLPQCPRLCLPQSVWRTVWRTVWHRDALLVLSALVGLLSCQAVLTWGGEVTSLRTGSPVIQAEGSGHGSQHEDATDWIEKLQSKDYLEREAATNELSRIDFKELTAVVPLLTIEDAEVAWRAREILHAQGVRGSSQESRRIHLMFQLLTSAGYRKFAEDAAQFSERVAADRTQNLLRKLQDIDGLRVTEGMQFVGNQFGIGRAVINGPNGIVVLPNNRILEVEPPFDVKPRDPFGNPPQVPPIQDSESDVETADAETASDTPAARRRRREELRTQINDYLTRCIITPDATLETLEQEWETQGFIQPPQARNDGLVTQYDLLVTDALSSEQLKTLEQFMINPVFISLTLSQVELNSEWSKLIVDSAEAGKLQMLNTVKCTYDLETYRQLWSLMQEGKLGYWEAQGRAMLGIRSANMGIERLDLPGPQGAEVGPVTEDSAADVAGIQTGDLITQVDTIPIRSFEELRRVVSAFDVNDVIEVQVLRRGEREPLKLSVKLMPHAQ